MDHLWTPWRYAYITAAETSKRRGVPKALDAWQGDLGCVFCNLMAAIDNAIANRMDRDKAEAAGGLVLRGRQCFICLNAFPYTSGHVLVMPYAHLDRLAALPVETAHELMDLAQRTERMLDKVYKPHGFNFGMNVGQAAGRALLGMCICMPCRAGLRHEFCDHRERDARIAGRSGDDVEAAAGGFGEIQGAGIANRE